MKYNLKKLCFAPILLLSFYSYGISLNQCDTFKNTDQNFIQEGTFSNTLYDREGNKLNTSFLDLFGFNYCKPDSIHISVKYYRTIRIIFDDISGPCELSYKGKQRRKYFKLYLIKKRFYIPLFYSNVNIVRYKIRSIYTGDLEIKQYTNTSSNWFFFAAGGSSRKTYLLKK